MSIRQPPANGGLHEMIDILLFVTICNIYQRSLLNLSESENCEFMLQVFANPRFDFCLTDNFNE